MKCVMFYIKKLRTNINIVDISLLLCFVLMNFVLQNYTVLLQCKHCICEIKHNHILFHLKKQMMCSLSKHIQNLKCFRSNWFWLVQWQAWFILEQQPGVFFIVLANCNCIETLDLDTLLRLQSTSFPSWLFNSACLRWSGRKYQWYRLVSHTRESNPR